MVKQKFTIKSNIIKASQKFKRIKLRKRNVIVGVTLLLVGLLAYTQTAQTNKNEAEPPITQDAAGVVEPTIEEAPVTPVVPEPISTPPPVVVPSTSTPTPTSTPNQSKWPVTYSLSEAESLTVVVNKKHKLPSNYAPPLEAVAGGNMHPEAAQALRTMLDAASTAGYPMKIISSYRSYDTQVSTYQKWVNQDGKAQADRSSARAGHSEHQTGLAVDLGMPDGSCNLSICFGSTEQGKWLAANAANYGFIVRYESDTEAVTGYQYEPWHMRFVGTTTATAVVTSGLTLDQYFGVEAGGYE